MVSLAYSNKYKEIIAEIRHNIFQKIEEGKTFSKSCHAAALPDTKQDKNSIRKEN